MIMGGTPIPPCQRGQAPFGIPLRELLNSSNVGCYLHAHPPSNVFLGEGPPSFQDWKDTLLTALDRALR